MVSQQQASDPLRLAEQGQWIVEAIGELFLHNRFEPSCREPSLYRLFSAARLERFTSGKFPRILIDPTVIDGSSLTVDRLKADLRYLSDIVSKNPKAFKHLAASLDSPQRFAETAKRLGLTEAAFIASGGGLWWIVLVVVAVVLTGCDGSSAPPPPPPPPSPCTFSDPISGEACILPGGHTRLGTIGGSVFLHRGASGATW